MEDLLPATVAGLPLHPLVVHVAVVLVPLAALGAVVVALSPAARRRYGTAAGVLALLAAAAVPLASGSGENLERALPRTAAIHTHAALGDGLLLPVLAMLVAVGAVLLLDRRRVRADGPGTAAAPPSTGRRLLGAGLAALVLVTAVVATVQTVRVGDSGARAVWGDSPAVVSGG